MGEAVMTSLAPAALGPYSQAVKTGSLVFLSGQLGLDPQTGVMREGVEAQAQQVMANLKVVLEAAGSGFDRVVKTTIFLADMADFATVNTVYGAFFTGSTPARSTVQVAALPKGGLVEIDMVAEL